MKKQLIKIRNRGIVAATAVSGGVLNATAVRAQEGGISEGVNSAAPSSIDPDRGLFDDGGIFQTIADVLLFIVGAISVIMLIIGGIRYVVSAGDQQAVTNAKNTILYAIVGIVISFLAFAAVRFVVDRLEA